LLRHALAASSAKRTSLRIMRRRLPMRCARSRLARGEFAEESHDPRDHLLRRITVRVEVVGLEPDPAAALARLVDERIALVLALDGQQTDVVDRAFACVRVRIGATAHSFERREAGVQQDAIQVRNVEPETAALAAAEEDAVP